VLAIFNRGNTVGDIEATLAQHRAGGCLHCDGTRKGPQLATATAAFPATA
jgi:hypothetical protein